MSQREVNTGDYLILDAVNNRVYVNPTQAEIDELKTLEAKLAEEKSRISEIKRFACSDP